MSFTVTEQPGQLPDARSDPYLTFHALAPDGTRLLLGLHGASGLWLVPLAAGAGPSRFVPFPREPDRAPDVAALAPGGDRVAGLGSAWAGWTDDDSRAAVTVVDIESGQARELWSAAGAPTADAVATWSPDGRFIAVTWVDADDHNHSAVLDDDGTLVVDLPEMDVLAGTRLAWTGDHGLLLLHEYWDHRDGPAPVVLLDPTTGDRRHIERPKGIGVLGALDGRLVQYSREGRIWSTAVDGSDPRTLLTFEADLHPTFLDATPGALDAHDVRHVPDARTTA